jgi:hypothetical protein
MITPELMERFFTGKCSSGEAQMIQQYFADNPEELDKYFNISEWDNAGSDEGLPSKISEGIFKAVKNSSYNRTNKRKLIIEKLSVAASVIVLLGIFIFMHNDKATDKSITQVTKVKPVLLHNINNDKTNKIIWLSDSSRIELLPGSELSYMNTFNESSRSVSLIGEAIFSVTKNNTKPFIVHSENFSTTDLGTKFKVNATRGSLEQGVKLYEGRVMIELNRVKDKDKNKYYLKPAEEFVFNTKDFICKVQSFKTTTDKKHNRLSRIKTTQGWYMFNGQPLALVFKQLEKMYNIHISYNENDIKNIYFIGRFENTEPVDSIISRITKINNLSFTFKGNQYVIIQENR